MCGHLPAGCVLLSLCSFRSLCFPESVSARMGSWPSRNHSLLRSESSFHHQGLFHSERRNPSLNCFHRRRSLAIIGHAGPRWRIRLSLHLVLGLPCRLVHYCGVHSVTLLLHLLSLNRAMCPAHPCILFLITSMMSFTPV